MLQVPRSEEGRTAPHREAIADGLAWLSSHQSTEGYWDADEFHLRERVWGEEWPRDRGSPIADIGLTGLALLAYLEEGHEFYDSPYEKEVFGGITWLRGIQREDGLFGEELGNPTLHNQGYATLALAEAYEATKRSPVLTRTLRRSLELILAAQNPGSGWGYKLEPNGRSNTAVTGLMVLCLRKLQANGLEVPEEAFAGAAAWYRHVAEPGTQRIGYSKPYLEQGGYYFSVRLGHHYPEYPAELSEALTALFLCGRLLGMEKNLPPVQGGVITDALREQIHLLRARPPEWDEEKSSLDFYYWLHGTYAIRAWGGAAWEEWNRCVESQLVPHQNQEPNENHGSWEPIDAWSIEGGRVYSTAMCVLILQSLDERDSPFGFAASVSAQN